jgi:translin
VRPAPSRRDELEGLAQEISAGLRRAHAARETALPLCREVIRLASRSIRAVHRGEAERSADHARDAEVALRQAQAALADFPEVAHAGPLHDAEKEYAESRLTAALLSDDPLPSPAELGVAGSAWLRGLAEAASELRRHLLDGLRQGDLTEGDQMLDLMDEVYEALFAIDFPDAITGGLRRTVDQLRAVLERTRGDVTTSVVQERLRSAIESSTA